MSDELPEPFSVDFELANYTKKVAYFDTQSYSSTAAGDESSTCLHATQTLACMVRRYNYAYPNDTRTPQNFMLKDRLMSYNPMSR